MTFTGVLQAIGQGFTKGLKWAVEYAVPAEKLTALLFPAAAPELKAVADATSLLQNAVMLVEQKFAATGAQSGSGAQKLEEVMLVTAPAVTALLKQAGIEPSTDYIAKLVAAVVAVLNVQNISSATVATKS